MTPRTTAAAVPVLLAALLAAGCSSDDDTPATASDAPAATTPSTDALPPPLPSLAGPAEADSVGSLPAGPAEGTVVISYSGMGELRAPFAGSCTQTDDGTTLAGSADGAQITLVFGPTGARLEVDDLGLESTASVGAGDLAVTGGRLSLQAPLVSGEQVIGDVDLDIACAI